MSSVLSSQKILFACISLILCTSLSSCRVTKDKGNSSHYEADSTNTTIHERTITIHDTVPILIPVEKHSSIGEDSSHLETDFATSDAFIDSTGKLHHNLENKARQIDVPVSGSANVSDTNHYESHTKIDSVFIPQPYPVEKLVEKPLAWWQKTLMYAGVLGLALLALWIMLKLKVIK